MYGPKTLASSFVALSELYSGSESDGNGGALPGLATGPGCQVLPPCSHRPPQRVRPRQTKAPCYRGFRSVGGTGLEPVTPSLSRWGSRSRLFASVRLNGVVARTLLHRRTAERTRTNAEPCHSCHARRCIEGIDPPERQSGKEGATAARARRPAPASISGRSRRPSAGRRAGLRPGESPPPCGAFGRFASAGRSAR
jgi:hypothetical protein